MDGWESDEDEPGDVEAALRRLEGIVDSAKEREKARRVERQMLKRPSQTDGPGELAEGKRRTRASTSASQLTSTTSSDLPSVTDEEEPTEVLADKPEAEPALSSSTGSAVADESATIPVAQVHRLANTSPSKRHGRTLTRRATLSGKPSIGNFFTINFARPISARPTPSGPVHRSFILGCHIETLAEQLTLLERDLFKALSWQELVGGSWLTPSMRFQEVLDWQVFFKEDQRARTEAKGRGESYSRTIQAVVARYNLTCNWVASEILLTFDLEERTTVVIRFIRLAFKCFQKSNFQTLAQIIHGLGLPDVARLKKTWARIPKQLMQQYRLLQDYTSPNRNFKLLRGMTAAYLRDYRRGASKGQARDTLSPSHGRSGHVAPGYGGCLPFLGIFFKDLATLSELPTFLDPSSTSSPASVDERGALTDMADPAAFDALPSLPGNVALQPLVNMHKFRLISVVVHQVLSFQDFADDYQYRVDPKVFHRVMRIRCLDSRTMAECSARLV